METALQDDIHLAVFDHASCLLHYLLPGWVDDFGVHATYKGERLELGVQCERLILSIIYARSSQVTNTAGGGNGLLGYFSSSRWRLYVLLVLDLSLCGSRARFWRCD